MTKAISSARARGAANLILRALRPNLWRLHPYAYFRQPLAHIAIDRPIYLLGVQGGGLSLLSRMIRRNPVIVTATGNSKHWAGPDELQNVMGDFLPPELSGISSKRPRHPRYPETQWIYATDAVLPFYRQTKASATDELKTSLESALRLNLALFGRKIAGPRFLDKGQSNTVRLSLVNALLREYRPRFLLITRNPFALCYRSAQRVGALQRLNLSLPQRLSLAAQHWKNSFHCALEDSVEVAHFMVVRFEDLLREPEVQLIKICEFLEISFDPDMLPRPSHRLPLGSIGTTKGDHKWYPLRPDVNRPYLEQLEPWMIEIIDNETGALAGQWGYSPAGSQLAAGR